MRHRHIRRLAVALPVSGALLLAAPSPASAASHQGAPPGDPHAEGVKGNPHAGEAGNPHAASSDTSAVSNSNAAGSSTGSSSSSSSTISAATVAASSTVKASAAGGHGGKPANGTVGNANGKKPPGQSNNDKNKGHECDGNKGIGKGNPAHSGCSTNITTPTTTPTTTDTTTPSVLGETVTRPAKVLGVSITRSGASLATTGSTPVGDPIDLTVLGLGLIAFGLGLRKWVATT